MEVYVYHALQGGKFLLDVLVKHLPWKFYRDIVTISLAKSLLRRRIPAIAIPVHKRHGNTLAHSHLLHQAREVSMTFGKIALIEDNHVFRHRPCKHLLQEWMCCLLTAT